MHSSAPKLNGMLNRNPPHQCGEAIEGENAHGLGEEVRQVMVGGNLASTDEKVLDD